MPSISLNNWRTDRMPNIQEIDDQCAASLVLVPANPRFEEENIRGYIVLLSAHF